MPPTPSADTISYGPRRSPGASRICRSGADYSRGAASDLPRPIQSSRIRLGCTAAIQLEARSCWLWPPSAGGFTRASCSVIIHDSSFAEVAERQTHQLEGLAGATPWRFESSLPHQQLTGLMRPVIELLQRLLVYSCDASTPSFRTAAPCRNSMLSRVRASVRLAATSKEPKTEQRAAEERERARFWHGVHIRNNGAGEERGRERERRSLRYHNRSRRKRQQEGIEVGHESARHKPRRSAAKGG